MPPRQRIAPQNVPRVLVKMLGDSDAQKAGRVMEAMLRMKKIDIAELERAYGAT
jgi:predicted 3-demethylubiquinone-9 3-methyltransferase (glyoxalase superfamily)